MRTDVTLNPCKLLDLKHIPELGVNNKYLEIECPKSEVNAETPAVENLLTEQSILKRYIGIILAISTSLVFSFITLFVKHLSARYHVFNVGLWRYISGLIPTLALPGSKKTLLLIIYRSAATCTSVLVEFFALNYISMSDLSVIGYCTPIGVTIMAYFVLREGFSLIQIGACVGALIGVLIIARPPFLTGADGFDMDHLLGLGISGGAVALRVTTLICLRYLRETNYLVMQLVLGFWGVGQAFVMSLCVGHLKLPEEAEDWALAFGLGLAGFLGQTCLTLALKYETSGVVAMVRCVDVVFAFLLQFIFLGIVPDLFSFIGAALVLLSMGIVGLRKAIMELPPDHPTRIRLLFLLR